MSPNLRPYLRERLLVSLCMVIALMCLLRIPLSAQNSQGTILGHVTDPSGGALAGASVIITNPATSVTSSAKTSSIGDYVFVNVIPGNYNIAVEAQGFKKAQAVGVRLDVDATLRQNFKLEVGTFHEEMTVTSNTQMVQTDNEIGRASCRERA